MDLGATSSAPTGTSREDGREAVSYRLALSATAFLLSLPVLFIRYPPLADYPNHLARTYVLRHYNDVPAFHQAYERVLAPIPNIAMDVVLLLLQMVLPAEPAGRVFLVGVVLLFVLGCHMLGRAIHGRPTWLAIPCCFLVYTAPLFWGFLNYVLGLTFFCITLALWLNFHRAWTAKRLAVVTALVMCAYLAHLTAYAFLGIACGLLTVKSAWQRTITVPAALAGMLPLVPPIVAFIIFMRGGGSVGRIVPNTMAGKIAGILAPVLSYNRVADGLYLLGLMVVAGLVIRGRPRVHMPTLIIGAIFLGIFAIAPLTLLTASAVDTRFVLPGFILVILSIRAEPTRLNRVLLPAVYGLAVLHLAVVSAAWHTLSLRTRAVVVALDGIPRESRVFPWFIAPVPDPNDTRSLSQTVHYATVRRNAYIPSLFAVPGQQPLIYRSPRERVRGTVTSAQWRPGAILRDYDYLWAYGVHTEVLDSVARSCIRISERDDFFLCKLQHQSMTPNQE